MSRRSLSEMYEFFEGLREGPQVQADPLDSGACFLPVSEDLKSEQESVVQKAANRLADLDVAVNEAVLDVLRDLVRESEKAEGEDTSDVEN